MGHTRTRARAHAHARTHGHSAHAPPCPRQESRWAHIQNSAAKKTLLLGTIKMATLNLFQIVSKQLKEATFVSLEDTHKQLDMVRGGPSARPAGSTEPRWFSIGRVEEGPGQGSGPQILTGSEPPGGWEDGWSPPAASDSVGQR